MAKTLVKVTAASQGVQTRIQAGKHELIIDEPVQLGGKGEGPNPLSTLLSALAGCENVIAHMVAKEMGFHLQGIEFDIQGEIDPRGLMGDPSVRPYFQKVTIHAQVRTEESEERIQELRQKTDSRCPLYTTLKAADVELVSHWKKA